MCIVCTMIATTVMKAKYVSCILVVSVLLFQAECLFVLRCLHGDPDITISIYFLSISI